MGAQYRVPVTSYGWVRVSARGVALVALFRALGARALDPGASRTVPCTCRRGGEGTKRGVCVYLVNDNNVITMVASRR